MEYKFQKLDVYRLGLEFVDSIYSLAKKLPASERFNLRSQIERASTSIVLNVAEGSTGQSDMEQGRFLGMALRSYLETVACIDLIEQRNYLTREATTSIREQGHRLFVKLQAFRKALKE
jgi:four helix bundle protein